MSLRLMPDNSIACGIINKSKYIWNIDLVQNTFRDIIPLAAITFWVHTRMLGLFHYFSSNDIWQSYCMQYVIQKIEDDI